MITRTSYYLRYKKFGNTLHSYEDVRTLKQLEKAIKQFIDLGISFDVWVKFSYHKNFKKFNYVLDDSTSFEIWTYDAITNEVFNYNLRKNMYYKTLRKYERRLRHLMLRYGQKKGE